MELILLAHFQVRFYEIYLFHTKEKKFASDLVVEKDSADFRAARIEGEP